MVPGGGRDCSCGLQNGSCELKKRYEKQLAYYQQALERTTGKKVKEKIIYSLALDEELVL